MALAGCGGVGGPGPDPDPDPDPTAWTITVKQSSPVPDPAYWVYIIDRTPLLDWADVPDAATYEIQIAPEYTDVNVPDFTGTTPVIECSTSSYQVTAAYAWESDWFWRVRAVKADGTTSAWSMPFQFYVAQDTVIVPFPADGEEIKDTTPVLDWNDIAGAVSYELKLCTDAGGAAVQFTVSDLVASEYQLTAGQELTPGTTRYWFLRGRNDDGEYGLWSTSFDLSVSTADIPVGNLRNNVITIDKTPLLQWNAVSGAHHYELLFGDSAADLDLPTAPRVTVDAPTVEYEVLSPYAFGSHKYWRIEVYSAPGHTLPRTAVSADLDFTVSTAYHPIGTPNGETGTPPTLRWTPMLGTDTYDLEIAHDVDFHDITETASPTTASSTATAAVNPGSSRFWRIRARNEDGDTTSWSPAFCFTVSWNDDITLQAPANGATIFDQTPLLNWSDVSSSHTYEVWVSDTFPIVPSLSTKYITGTASQQQIGTALPMEQTRYWRVRPRNLDGVVGAWSSTFQFTPSATVALNPLPVDGYTDSDTTPAVAWSDVEGAASYWVQWAPNAAGVASGTLVNRGTLLGYTFSMVPEGSYRYWRVQAKNDNGTASAWTPIASVGVTWSYTITAISPAHKATNVSKAAGLLIDWSAVTGASSYEIQSSTAQPFGSGGIASCATHAYTTSAPLLANTKYYWRARPVNSESIAGSWSDTFDFTTGP